MKKFFLFTFIWACALCAFGQKGEFVGGDISMLLAYEKHNSGYLTQDGNQIPDLIAWYRDYCGWNSMRVRLFVEPKEPASGVEGVIQDLEYVKALGKRIKDAGMDFVLDFHYSDTWADPAKQYLPASWADCTTPDKKAARLYDYTKDVLQQLKVAGATPDQVQVGNEITYGMVGISVHPYDMAGDDWDGLCKVLKSGCKAVREECPDAKIIIHTERSCKMDQTVYYYNKLKDGGVDYDVIGLSYYPFYHGYLPQLKANLNALATSFPDKTVEIMETAYFFQYFPSAKEVTYDTSSTWPGTADGQYKFMNDLMAELALHDNVKGLYWWFPEEAGCGDDSDWDHGGATVISGWLNRGMWWEDQTSTGHWPVVSSNGYVGKLMGDFVDRSGVQAVHAGDRAGDNCIYDISGKQFTQCQRGSVNIKDGKKVYLAK